MYAARSIPFGLATAFTPFFAGGIAVACLLFTAAAIQLADVVLGVETKNRKMILGASVAATVGVRIKESWSQF